MVKIELEVTEHLRYNNPVLGGHVHPHEQHRGDEVHAHYLGQHQYYDVRTFAGGHSVKKLKQA